MALVRLKTDIVNPRYFLYHYLSPEYQSYLRSRTISGSTVDRILLTEFPDFPIEIPTLSEQKVIAHILGTLDDKIELNREMNKTLESMAKAIFKSWFVDFDPVQARAEGRKPVGMNEEIADLFPPEFVDSEMGEIPKGWDIKKLSEAVMINPMMKLMKGVPSPYLEMKKMC